MEPKWSESQKGRNKQAVDYGGGKEAEVNKEIARIEKALKEQVTV